MNDIDCLLWSVPLDQDSIEPVDHPEGKDVLKQTLNHDLSLPGELSVELQGNSLNDDFANNSADKLALPHYGQVLV